jgi:hypothetical protein
MGDNVSNVTMQPRLPPILVETTVQGTLLNGTNFGGSHDVSEDLPAQRLQPTLCETVRHGFKGAKPSERRCGYYGCKNK